MCHKQATHDFFYNLKRLSILQPDPVILQEITDALGIFPLCNSDIDPKLLKLCQDKNSIPLYLEFRQVGCDSFAEGRDNASDLDPDSHRHIATHTLRDITIRDDYKQPAGVKSSLTVLPIGYLVGAKAIDLT